MANEKELEQQEVENEAEVQEEQESSSAETENTDIMIPKTRFDEVNNRLKSLEKERENERKAARKAEEKRLAEQEDWKTLHEQAAQRLAEIEPKAEFAEKAEEALQNYLKAEIDTLPEQYRDIVPDDLSTIGKLNWLAKNKAKFMKASPVDLGAGKRGVEGGGDVELTAEEMATAEKFGMKPEEYAKFKE